MTFKPTNEALGRAGRFDVLKTKSTYSIVILSYTHLSADTHLFFDAVCLERIADDAGKHTQKYDLQRNP